MAFVYLAKAYLLTNRQRQIGGDMIILEASTMHACNNNCMYYTCYKLPFLHTKHTHWKSCWTDQTINVLFKKWQLWETFHWIAKYTYFSSYSNTRDKNWPYFHGGFCSLFEVFGFEKCINAVDCSAFQQTCFCGLCLYCSSSKALACDLRDRLSAICVVLDFCKTQFLFRLMRSQGLCTKVEPRFRWSAITCDFLQQCAMIYNNVRWSTIIRDVLQWSLMHCKQCL